MRGRSWSLVLSVVLVAVAGCLGDDGAPAPGGGPGGAETAPSRLEEALASGNRTEERTATADDWFLMLARSGPQAAIHAFNWTIPPKSVRDVPAFPGSATTSQQIPLEFTFESDGGPILEWAIVVFGESEGELVLRNVFIATPMRTMSFIAAIETVGTTTPSLGPIEIHLSATQFLPGDTAHFVIAARSAEEGELAVAMRVREDVGAPLPGSIPELRQLAGGGAPFRPDPAGTGTGFHYSVYARSDIYYALGSIVQSESLDMDDRSLVAVGAFRPHEDMTFRASFPQGGWGSTMFLHLFSDGIGSWSTDLELHGETLQHEALVASSSVPLAGSGAILLFGLPLYGATHEDQGSPSAITTTLQTASSGFRYTVFEHLEIGATMGQLFGTPARPAASLWEGLLPPAPLTAFVDGEDLVLRLEGERETRLQGAAIRNPAMHAAGKE